MKRTCTPILMALLPARAAAAAQAGPSNAPAASRPTPDQSPLVVERLAHNPIIKLSDVPREGFVVDFSGKLPVYRAWKP
jgi:hypothetical protein